MIKEEIIQTFKTIRTGAISRMLDNPDSIGIFPTSKCFNELDNGFDILISEYAKQVAIGFKDWLDNYYCCIQYGPEGSRYAHPKFAHYNIEEIPSGEIKLTDELFNLYLNHISKTTKE